MSVDTPNGRTLASGWFGFEQKRSENRPDLSYYEGRKHFDEWYDALQ